MAKNVESYIEDAVEELQKETVVPWELIVIDDHSDDNTFKIVEAISENDNRIRIYKNKYVGKVKGTNYGYSLCNGDIIKCIDSDDILLKEFFNEYDLLRQYDAHCHSANIVDQNLNFMGNYNINPAIIDLEYSEVIKNFISIPKWSWSFKRKVADKVFPMPENLPFEDVWMSILIKKNSASIYNISKPLYLYRQHGTQTFGGILNYSYDKVKFRAERLIRLINIIVNEQNYLVENIEDPFKKMSTSLNLQIRKSSISDILSADISFKIKIKLIIILHFPYLAVYVTRIKWKLDKFLSV